MGFDFNSLLAFIIFGVTIGVVYGIVALGISLIYSGLDIVHFAHGEMYMFGAFFGLVLAHNVGVPYPVALIGAMILTAILGMLVERVFYRRLTRAGGGYTVAGMGMIICGFGMSVALVNAAYFFFGAEAEPFRANLDYIPRLTFPGDINVPESYVLTAIISVLLMAGLHYFLRHFLKVLVSLFQQQ